MAFNFQLVGVNHLELIIPETSRDELSEVTGSLRDAVLPFLVSDLKMVAAINRRTIAIAPWEVRPHMVSEKKVVGGFLSGIYRYEDAHLTIETYHEETKDGLVIEVFGRLVRHGKERLRAVRVPIKFAKWKCPDKSVIN